MKMIVTNDCAARIPNFFPPPRQLVLTFFDSAYGQANNASLSHDGMQIPRAGTEQSERIASSLFCIKSPVIIALKSNLSVRRFSAFYGQTLLCTSGKPDAPILITNTLHFKTIDQRLNLRRSNIKCFLLGVCNIIIIKNSPSFLFLVAI
jgi:hypothetical protein